MNAQNAALDVIQPGVKISEVHTVAEKEYDVAGLKIHESPLGHGLGVECNEMPWIQRDNEEEFLEGMVVNIDIPYLELGWGGIQLEDTIMVTADGYEILTKTDRTLYLL